MTQMEVMFALGIKILVAWLYGYIFLHYYKGDDTWALHSHSLKEKQMLLDDPYRFFWEFTPATAIRNGNSFIDIIRFYLNDLEYCLQAKTLGFINLISRGNYYINAIFWNFFIFWGHYWLFKVLVTTFPAKRNFYFLLIFFFPPAVFWLSGIRSDGLLFVSFSLLVLYFNRWLLTRWWSSALIGIAGFIGVLIFRSPVAALLVPALISWWLATRFERKPLFQFVWVYSLAATVFFLSAVFSSNNLPGIVVQRQREFMRLKGSSLPLDTLQPTIKSFTVIFPQATVNSFIRPYLWEAKGILQGMAALEIIIFWGMLIFIFVYHDPDWKTIINQPLILFLVFWSISLYVFVGYTIPFPGAIIRYKIIAELCMLAALISLLKHQRFKN
jgi:hypothetical protein